MFRDYVCSADSPDSVYVIQPGDSLWRIAARELNDSNRWPEIASYNMLQAPYTLFVGQRLYLPATQTAHSAIPTTFLTPASPQTCVEPLTGNNSGAEPAKTVDHAPVKLKLDEDIPVLLIKFPGGEAEIGFKGELVMYRTSPLPITVTRDGLKAEYESSQKDWATPKYISLFNSLGVSVDRNGALTIIGKAGMETEWYKGTFEITQDGAMKYEVEPKSIKANVDDLILEGTIGCWIKLKSNIKFDPSWSFQTSPVLTQQQIRNLIMVLMVAAAGVAATGVSTMTFGQFLNLVLRSAAGTASSFMLIIVPPGVLKEFQGQSNDPSDYMI